MTPAAAELQALVVLVADKQMEFAIRGLLSRHHALAIREIEATVYRHPNSDPGCRKEAHNFLRPFHSDFHHALVLFDRHGCGRSEAPVKELQREVEEQLQRTGWDDRARCVVLDPELEVWVWSDSPEVNSCLGWQDRDVPVQEWLKEQGLWDPVDAPKPAAPKDALEVALREVGIPRSAAVFEKLARRVSVNRCTDESFGRLRTILQEWFPLELAS